MQKIEAAAMDHPLWTSTEKIHGEAAVDKVHTLLKKRLDKVPGIPNEERPVTIFRLPSCFHETNKYLCEPKMVAIGPYHHGKESLQAMEEHKLYTLRNFLARTGVGLEAYCQEMQSIEAQARQCYSEPVNQESDDFVMMLLLDGCFILEWILNMSNHEMDNICGIGWAITSILCDVLNSENQIPFFVIHKLWATQYCNEVDLQSSQECNDIQCPLIKIICKLFRECTDLFLPRQRPQISCKDIHHLLHLYYSVIVADPTPQTLKTKVHNNIWGLGCSPCSKLFSKSSKAHAQSSSETNIPCVTELHDAGVKFKKKMEPRDMFDISFENGTIEMPSLVIDKTRMILLWNMAVFEQSWRPTDFPQNLSSYLALMDSLINTKEDIATLERFGIVDNFGPNAEEAADFFNQFADHFGLDYDDHYFKDLYKNVKEYSESTWHTYRARLMHDYFNNPWSIISVVAATILLILTMVQTYYSAAK